jgi:hypothetical protein
MQKKKLNHLILAEGEVTGHAHRANRGTLYDNGNGTMTLEPETETTITHEEHAPLNLPTSDPFNVRIVQEYDHAAEAARNVAD